MLYRRGELSNYGKVKKLFVFSLMMLLDIIAERNKSFYRFLKMNKNYLRFCENSLHIIYENTIYSESINSNVTNHPNLKIINEIYDMYKKDDGCISYYLASDYEVYIFVRDLNTTFDKTLEEIFECTNEYYETDSNYRGPNIYIIAEDCDRAIEYAKEVNMDCVSNCYYILFKSGCNIDEDFYPKSSKQISENTKKILIEKLECDIGLVRDF